MRHGAIIERLARHVAEREIPPSSIPINVPQGEDEMAEGGETLGYAEGQSFIIEYVDSAGLSSTRRITVFEITQGRAGVPSLMARCHERKATRQFRVDRIRACIDFDGEVHDDVPAFLFDNFGMSLGVATRTSKNDAAARWLEIRDFIKPDAVVLSALSHSDGHVHELERQDIEQHLTFVAEHAKGLLSDPEIVAIGRFVERLRPTENAISAALETIARRTPDAIMRLLRAAVAVIDADGRRHPAEIAMLDEFCFELTGIRLA